LQKLSDFDTYIATMDKERAHIDELYDLNAETYEEIR